MKNVLRLLTVLLAAVLILPTAIFAVDAVDAEVFVGKTVSIASKVDAGKTVTGWYSKNTSIATVNTNGVVTGVAEGTVKVCAMIENQDDDDEFTVEVKKDSLVDLDLTPPTNLDYYTGDALNTNGLIAVAKYASTDTKTLNSTEYQLKVPNGLNVNSLTAGQHTFTVSYTENGTTVSKTFTINVTERLPVKIAVDSTAPSTYELNAALERIPVRVTYNNGSEEIILSGYTVDPATANQVGSLTYTVTYFGLTATKTVTVTGNGGGGGGGESDTVTVTFEGSFTKKEYKVGDKIDATGVTFEYKKGNETIRISGTELSDLINAGFNDNKGFTTSDIGKNKQFTIRFNYKGGSVRIPAELTVFTVTAKTQSMDVASITSVTMKKTTYPIGYVFAKDDIKSITYRDGDNVRQTVNSSDFDLYDDTITLEVLSVNSRGQLVQKSSSYRSIIEEADVETSSSGKKTVNLRLTVGTKTFDFTIDIGEAGVYVYYNNKLVGTYDYIDDALDAFNVTAGGEDLLSNYSDSKTITLKLGSNQQVTKRYEFAPARYFQIDLNGKELSIYTSTFVFTRNNKYTVTVGNTAETEGKLTYTDKADTIKLAKSESIVFQYSSTDEIPGYITVTIGEVKNGSVSTKPELDAAKSTVTVPFGTDVVFTATPSKDYEIDTVKVGNTTVKTTAEEYVINANTGVLTYTLKDVTKNTTVTITFKAKATTGTGTDTGTTEEWINPFTDVNTYNTYYDAVKFVNQHGIMNGTSTTTFGPNEKMTRAQFVTTLGRMYGFTDETVKNIYGTDSKFTDVNYNSYDSSTFRYAIPYIRWATEMGLIQGYGDGTFGPTKYITNQQMYIIMLRYAEKIQQKKINVSGVVINAIDADEIGKNWSETSRNEALRAVRYAQQQGFLANLTANKIEPTTDALRSQLAVLLCGFAKNVLAVK